MQLNKVVVAVTFSLAFLSAESAPVSETHPVAAPELISAPAVIEKVPGIWVPLVKILKDTPTEVALVKDNPVKAESWKIVSGAGLHETIQNWAEKAGWQVSWELGPDMAITSDAEFSGSFNEAVSDLVLSINASSGTLIHAHFFSGNNVLRIYKEI